MAEDRAVARRWSNDERTVGRYRSERYCGRSPNASPRQPPDRPGTLRKVADPMTRLRNRVTTRVLLAAAANVLAAACSAQEPVDGSGSVAPNPAGTVIVPGLPDPVEVTVPPSGDEPHVEPADEGVRAVDPPN